MLIFTLILESGFLFVSFTFVSLLLFAPYPTRNNSFLFFLPSHFTYLIIASPASFSSAVLAMHTSHLQPNIPSSPEGSGSVPLSPIFCLLLIATQKLASWFTLSFSLLPDSFSVPLFCSLIFPLLLAFSPLLSIYLSILWSIRSTDTRAKGRFSTKKKSPDTDYWFSQIPFSICFSTNFTFPKYSSYISIYSLTRQNYPHSYALHS